MHRASLAIKPTKKFGLVGTIGAMNMEIAYEDRICDSNRITFHRRDGNKITIIVFFYTAVALVRCMRVPFSPYAISCDER